jgi:hypothetical protein
VLPVSPAGPVKPVGPLKPVGPVGPVSPTPPSVPLNEHILAVGSEISKSGAPSTIELILFIESEKKQTNTNKYKQIHKDSKATF